jgi:hypothetical protein
VDVEGFGDLPDRLSLVDEPTRQFNLFGVELSRTPEVSPPPFGRLPTRAGAFKAVKQYEDRRVGLDDIETIAIAAYIEQLGTDAYQADGEATPGRTRSAVRLSGGNQKPSIILGSFSFHYQMIRAGTCSSEYSDSQQMCQYSHR